MSKLKLISKVDLSKGILMALGAGVIAKPAYKALKDLNQFANTRANTGANPAINKTNEILSRMAAERMGNPYNEQIYRR